MISTQKSIFFPQDFVLFYFRKSSHFTYVYIHIQYSYIRSFPPANWHFWPIPIFYHPFNFDGESFPPPLAWNLCNVPQRRERRRTVGEGLFMSGWDFGPWTCQVSVREKGAVKWGCLAAPPPPLTSWGKQTTEGLLRVNPPCSDGSMCSMRLNQTKTEALKTV